jgi:hypothetical protein
MTTLYIYILSATFSAFRCAPQDDGSFTLLSSPDLDCFDLLWYKNLWLILLGILILIFVPCSLYFILYRNQNRLMDNHFRWKFGYLILPYKKNFYFWEVIMLLRKTMFVSLVDLTNGWQKLDRSFVLLIFLFMELLVDVYLDPFEKLNTSFSIYELRIM